MITKTALLLLEKMYGLVFVEFDGVSITRISDNLTCTYMLPSPYTKGFYEVIDNKLSFVDENYKVPLSVIEKSLVKNLQITWDYTTKQPDTNGFGVYMDGCLVRSIDDPSVRSVVVTVPLYGEHTFTLAACIHGLTVHSEPRTFKM